MRDQTVALPRSDRLTIVKVVGFAIVLAAAAQVAIPLPGTPVPFTLQPLLVVLAGLWLSPRAAVASMMLYLSAGAVGLPVWAPIGLPGAARLIGLLSADPTIRDAAFAAPVTRTESGGVDAFSIRAELRM